MYYFQRVEGRKIQTGKESTEELRTGTKTEKIRIQGSSDQQSRRMYRVQKSG